MKLEETLVLDIKSPRRRIKDAFMTPQGWHAFSTQLLKYDLGLDIKQRICAFYFLLFYLKRLAKPTLFLLFYDSCASNGKSPQNCYENVFSNP